jgi:hypothetical protein
MNGHGCNKCAAAERGKDQRMTLATFLKRASDKWSSKFEYKIAEFEDGLNTEIQVKCPSHGYFTTSALAHIRGRGCVACGDVPATNKEEFLSRANCVHGLKYNYDRSIYIDSKTKIEIVCQKHGIFNQIPSQHLSGYGCFRCGIEQSIASRKMSPTTFLERAVGVWARKFDYSRTQFVDSHSPITIICPKHGPFTQIPYVHLKGHDCPACGAETRALSISSANTMTQEEFLAKAKQIHGDKYDYSSALYSGYHNPLSIGCRTHGIFSQKAGDHLAGSGCQKCRASRGEAAISATLDRLGLIQITQWIDHDLKVSRPLPFDHYIPDLRLVIEYDGQQHYGPVDFGGRNKERIALVFKGIKQRDRLKTTWARGHGYHFIRIPYWITDIEDLLSERIADLVESTSLVIDPPPGEGWNIPPN